MRDISVDGVTVAITSSNRSRSSTLIAMVGLSVSQRWVQPTGRDEHGCGQDIRQAKLGARCDGKLCRSDCSSETPRSSPYCPASLGIGRSGESTSKRQASHKVSRTTPAMARIPPSEPTAYSSSKQLARRIASMPPRTTWVTTLVRSGLQQTSLGGLAALTQVIAEATGVDGSVIWGTTEL
jgi:hypothetical protein